MNTCRQARGRGREIRAFTLIELLTVIGIIVLVLALALPNFVSMMKGRKWEAAISSIQTMVMRARALATNVRKDFSVEFLIDPDNGTTMWLESEVNAIERIPDLIELQRMVGGWGAISDFIQTFVASGGSYDTWYYESRCRVLSCGHKWSSYSEAAAKTCPKCGATGWEFGPEYIQMYYNITYDSSRSKTTEYGDNARQSEWVPLPRRITIDLARSVNFISWTIPTPSRPTAVTSIRISASGPTGHSCRASSHSSVSWTPTRMNVAG